MRKNEQNVVLNETLEALGNRSEIIRVLVLHMRAAGIPVVPAEVILSVSFFLVCQTRNNLVKFLKEFLTDPYVTSTDL